MKPGKSTVNNVNNVNSFFLGVYVVALDPDICIISECPLYIFIGNKKLKEIEGNVINRKSKYVHKFNG